MFSIIIPAHNEEKYITNCLKSILALKMPSNIDYEVIVVNSASTDRTPEIVKEIFPRAKLITEPKKGLTRAYNRGAKEARGEILVFVDADIVLPTDHLKKILKEFKKNPKLVILSGPCFFKSGGRFCDLVTRFAYLFLAMPAEFIFNRFLNFGAAIASGNSAIKKEAFEKVNGFNEKMFYGLETDLSLKLKKIGKIRFKYYFSVEGSSRRLKAEGVLKIVFLFILNILWVFLWGKAFTKDHIDVR